MAKRNAVAMAKLADWAQRFEKAASRGHKSALTKEMSKETLDLIEEGFRKESSPTGQKWRPKKRPNGEQILVETGAMREGFTTMVGLSRFSVENTQPYANRHNYGWDGTDSLGRRIPTPRRRMWPEANKLPAKWIRAYTSIFQERTFAILTKRKAKRKKRR